MNHRVRITHNTSHITQSILILFTLLFASSAFAATAIYRSVGPSATTALATGTLPQSTLTISGSTATFSSQWWIPNGIMGVGDAIQYDSDDNGSIDAICFIHGRTDVTHYTVKNAAGGTPTATSAADGDWTLYRAYTSLAKAESGDENDSIDDTLENFDTWSGGKNIVTSDEQWNIACYANGTTADVTNVEVDGWNTDATRYIRIYTPVASTEVGSPQRHDGKRNASTYRLMGEPDPWYVNALLLILDDFVRIEGLQVSNTATWGNTGGGISVWVNESSASVRITDTLIYDCHGGGFYIGRGQTVVLNNVVAMHNGGHGIAEGESGTMGFYAYNVTSVNNGGSGFYASNYREINCKNCYASGNAEADYTKATNGTLNLTTSYSEDGSESTPIVGFSTTSGAYFTNVTPGIEDLHISASSALKDVGTDLSGDSYWIHPNGNVDIERELRQMGAWDVGADEVPTPIYRSVGVGATSPLASGGSNALTIAGSTATFASDLPNDVGVGDAIQYDSDNGGTIDAICFIHGRTDTKHFTVKNAAGNAPTATSSADNDWAIYRAYTSLAKAESGDENDSINDTVEDFDTWSGGKDLVAAGQQWNIACYANGTTADITSVRIYGWTTSATSYIRIYTPTASSEVGTSQRHQGRWDTNKYRHEVTGDDFFSIEIDEVNHVRIDGLQIYRIRNNGTSDSYGAVRVYSPYGSSEIWISNSIIRGQSTGTTGANFGIAFSYAGTLHITARVWNNIIYDFINGSSTGFRGITCDAGTKLYAYNNTIANSYYGIVTNCWDSPQLTCLKNNIIQGGNTNYLHNYGGNYDAGTTNNLSSDATAPAYGTYYLTKDVAFINETAGSEDFHLALNDTEAKGKGANLFKDPYCAFADDIDGQTRASPWSLGVDGGLYQGKMRNAKIRGARIR